MQQGWYADPMGQAHQRWFDGQNWTTAVLDVSGIQSLEPIPPASPGPAPVASAAPTSYPSDWDNPPPGMSGAQTHSMPAAPRAWNAGPPAWNQAPPGMAPTPAWAPAGTGPNIAWLWTVLGVVATAAILVALPYHRPSLAFALAGLATAWGVASTRSNPAWGLLWGAVGAGIGFVHVHFGDKLYDHSFFYSHEKLGNFVILMLLSLLLAGVPTLAGAPRPRAFLGALVGAAIGSLTAVLLPDSAYRNISQWTSPDVSPALVIFNAALVLAPLGALAIGGVRRRTSSTPSPPQYGGYQT